MTSENNVYYFLINKYILILLNEKYKFYFEIAIKLIKLLIL